jgi:hypothetical protein
MRQLSLERQHVQVLRCEREKEIKRKSGAYRRGKLMGWRGGGGWGIIPLYLGRIPPTLGPIHTRSAGRIEESAQPSETTILVSTALELHREKLGTKYSAVRAQ